MGFLPIVAILLVFWLLIIRPQQRKQRETMRLQSSIQVGDQVMLTSGFFGTVTDLIEDKADVEIAPDVVVTVVRGAIANRVTESYDDAADDVTGDPTDDLDGDAPSVQESAAGEPPRLEKTTDDAPASHDPRPGDN
ncbi:preprotein translocase subunit YajC [Nocardioides sp. 1609]|uniref:preprotein translocase subunit YajC n=1 Tax=Nocardioides sp. 1609 TaxID=2508327 RepID=UPI0014320011|nr:preprotein translocase subunit YajC [Nocardioides sp. 1609]